MDTKKLAKTLPRIVGVAFCVVQAMKIWALSGASWKPDPATGRTDAALFAPAVSTDWSYITPNQSLILIAVTLVAILLALLLFAVSAWNRVQAFRQAALEPEPYSEQHSESQVSAPKSQSPKPRVFGRR